MMARLKRHLRCGKASHPLFLKEAKTQVWSCVLNRNLRKISPDTQTSRFFLKCWLLRLALRTFRCWLHNVHGLHNHSLCTRRCHTCHGGRELPYGVLRIPVTFPRVKFSFSYVTCSDRRLKVAGSSSGENRYSRQTGDLKTVGCSHSCVFVGCLKVAHKLSTALFCGSFVCPTCFKH